MTKNNVFACFSIIWKSFDMERENCMENFTPGRSKARGNKNVSDNLCIYYARGPICVFAFIALDWIFFSIWVENEDEGNLWGWRKKSDLKCANVYQIEKDVMYLNLIYVYLVTNGKMPFQWETNSICQSTNSLVEFSLCLLWDENEEKPWNDLMVSSVKVNICFVTNVLL